MSEQQLCDALYDMDNVVTVSIEMPEADWTALRNAEPHGGRCAHAFKGDRYDWFNVPEVVISGSSFPLGGAHSFPWVGLRKRSYCGSFSRAKPALAINFAKFNNANEARIENLIGTKYITLNNSRQDRSFIRQALGFELFKLAGLPYSRCNFARVRVNGGDVGLYINIEPIKEPYIQHNFGNKGVRNLYEIDSGEDLNQDTMESGRIGFEGFSNFESKKDLELAADILTARGAVGIDLIIDTAQFIRFFAMEILLKHWDGYTKGRNNAYIFNDVQAVANPTARNINFKFIPWGLDQILQSDRQHEQYDKAVLAKLIVDDPNMLLRLRNQIIKSARTVFGENNDKNVLLPLIAKMENILLAAGHDEVPERITSVRDQLELITGWGVVADWQAPLFDVLLPN